MDTLDFILGLLIAAVELGIGLLIVAAVLGALWKLFSLGGSLGSKQQWTEHDSRPVRSIGSQYTGKPYGK